MGTGQPDFDAEEFVPALPFIRVTQIADLLTVTDKHVLSLIWEGLIKVPKKLRESAPSGPAMRVPRKSVVEFVRERSSRNVFRKREETAKRGAKKKGRAVVETDSLVTPAPGKLTAPTVRPARGSDI